MSEIIDIADAVVEELNAGSYSQSFTAERHYLPELKLTETEDLHVLVVPAVIEMGQPARNALLYDYSIDVGILKKLQAADADEVDPLVDLVQEIADSLRLKRLTEYPDAAWVRAVNEPVFVREHFDDLRQFTSVLRLTYRLMR